MEWNQWEKLYPADEIDFVDPRKYEEGPFASQSEAESLKDKLEEKYEMGGLQVVKCGNEYFIIRN